MSKDLFEKERNFLKANVAHSLSDLCDASIINNLPTNFINTLYNSGDTPDLEIQKFEIETLFPKETTEADILIKYYQNEDIFNFETFEQLPIANLISEFGKDAFGMYLPFHYYDKCWGIYLFKEIIESRILFLHSLFKEKISLRNITQLYYYAIYRHELFHYQVERFATKIELVIKKPVYRISRVLFKKVRNSEDWLEEALAENAVTESKLVTNRTKVNAELLTTIYERDLKDMPAGYRDYKCTKFGGPDAAHKLFASQIIESVLNPSITVTDLFSVKNEFIAIDKKVPTFLSSLYF